MTPRDLLKHWVETASDVQTNHAYLVTLPLHDAARLHALAEMYPGRTEQQIITDLLSMSLDQLEGAFPYVQGNRVIARDEFEDPIFEDIGPTARFNASKKKYARSLLEDSTDKQRLVKAAAGQSG